MFYNITIISISVAVALIIGTVELIGVLAEQAKIDSGSIAAIADIPLDFAGYAIVGLFFLSWLIALAVWNSAGSRNAGRPASRPRSLKRTTDEQRL